MPKAATTTMRTIATTLIGGLTLMVGACGGDSEADACASVVVWEGETLTGIAVDDLPQRWPPVSREIDAETGSCTDDGGAAAGGTTRVAELRGVPPGVALARVESGRVTSLYLAEGYFLQLPGHPLHEGRYGSAREPDATGGRRCRAASAKAGSASYVSGWEGRITVAGAVWRVDSRTRMKPPRVRPGDRVTVRGVRCGRRFVARSITQ